MSSVAVLSGAPRDIGANHAVCFGNQEFYVQTRLARDGSGVLESEVFHKGRLLLKRRGEACPEDCVAAAEAIRTLQDETEAWLLGKLSHHVGRAPDEAPEPARKESQPERTLLMQRLVSLLPEPTAKDFSAAEQAELTTLVQEIWEGHRAKPWLVADAAVALLCARSLLKSQGKLDVEGLRSYLAAIVEGTI